MPWNKLALLVILALALVFAAADAAPADPVLTVTNGDFHQYSGTTPGTSNDYFTNVRPVGWTGAGGLIFITNYAGINNPNLYLQVYGQPQPTQSASLPNNPFPNSPIGGNFVEADGNPDYEDSFSYQLSGLTVGQEYQLSFFQAAGQQTGYTGNTTNQWIVGLGVPGSVFNKTYIGGNLYQYHYSDSNGSVDTTPLMSTVTGVQTVSPWEQVTVHLKADAPNDVLTFLAWGNNGSNINVPPIAFLDIANNGAPVDLSAAPEPSSLALTAIGVFCLGFVYVRQRRARLAAA